MNGTHALAAGTGVLGGTTVYDALTVVLTGFHGLDGDHAKAWAYLIIVVVTALGGGIAALAQRILPQRARPPQGAQNV